VIRSCVAAGGEKLGNSCVCGQFTAAAAGHAGAMTAITESDDSDDQRGARDMATLSS
jgi:hypothetical protein